MLENIRCLSKLDLTLAPDSNYAGWSVITGDNGSGKTALLRAIALCLLGPEQGRALVPDLGGWVTGGAKQGTISVEVRPNHDFDRTQKGGFPIKNTFWAEIAIREQADSFWEMTPLDKFRNKKKGAANGPWEASTPGWAALGYGPFRRMYGSSPDAQRLMVIPGRIPRFATLFKEDATLAEGEEWIKTLKYRSLERRDTGDETGPLGDLLLLLSDDFLRNGVTIHSVGSDGVVLKDATGTLIPLRDMSEGYRAALAMLIDIVRHFHEIYGQGLVSRTNDPDKSHYFVNKPGVVLIDEIDAHLHPAWQREIGFWLKQRFPLVQFIVTTHSPLVCQAADDGRIYHMPQPEQGDAFLLSRADYEEIIAGRPTEILLTPAFGLPHTRSPLAVEKRNRHAALRSKEIAGTLSPGELEEMGQLALFAKS